jgi:hypothetical protein
MRAVLLLGLAAFGTAPAAAQWLGMPGWNNPKGGTGVTVSGDYGRPNADAGKGNAFGGRVALGLGTLSLTAGVASWKPDNVAARATSYGGTGAFRLIGGSLLPVAVNLQVGATHSGESASGPDTLGAQTTVSAAVGLSVPLPTPGISIEPYISPGIRYHKASNLPAGISDHQTNVGWVIGANLSFGLLGIHVAYDTEKFDNGVTESVLGIGAHVGLKLPVGM